MKTIMQKSLGIWKKITASFWVAYLFPSPLKLILILLLFPAPIFSQEPNPVKKKPNRINITSKKEVGSGQIVGLGKSQKKPVT